MQCRHIVHHSTMYYRNKKHWDICVVYRIPWYNTTIPLCIVMYFPIIIEVSTLLVSLSSLHCLPGCIYLELSLSSINRYTSKGIPTQWWCFDSGGGRGCGDSYIPLHFIPSCFNFLGHQRCRTTHTPQPVYTLYFCIRNIRCSLWRGYYTMLL